MFSLFRSIRTLCWTTPAFIAVLGLLSPLSAAFGAGAADVEPLAAADHLDPYLVQFERQPSAAQMTALGRIMFFDPHLSASGKLSCASCHDPRAAYAPINAHAVQLGGASGSQPGVRAVPSLRYREAIPQFTEHFHEGEDVNGDQGPTGGYTWDGRAASAREQARLPLFSSFEMGNANGAAVAGAIRRAAYATEVTEAFGRHALDDDVHALAVALLSLEVFQQDAKEFYPFDSKYDAFLRGEAKLSRKELRGLALFENPKKGNCALCHPSSTLEGAFPTFTDDGYIALAVPRNRSIAANRDAHYFDLGLCGPYRTDLKDHKEYCGMFRTPSLRNVATRKVFFHNGAIKSLRDAVAFYAQRDTRPRRWYPKGVPDDMPAVNFANIDGEAPFGGKAGDQDPLNHFEIDDIVAFLNTLTDGFHPVSSALAHGKAQ